MPTIINSYNYLNQRGCLSDIGNYSLTSIDKSHLDNCLKSDRDGFFINALISYSSAINGIKTNNYSWAFVKLYYSLFYAIKTELSINDYVIFYHMDKLYCTENIVGNTFFRLHGNSHDAIFDFYSKTYSNNLFVTNKINNTKSFKWFKDVRDLVNYRINPMTDPDSPIKFHVSDKNMRDLLHTYLSDSLNIYTFDEEHAYLSFTTKIIDNIFNYYVDSNSKNVYLSNGTFKHISLNLCDKRGPLSLLIDRLKRIKE
jgi:hypothetical protein